MLPIDTMFQAAEIEARLNRRWPRPHPYQPTSGGQLGRGPRRVVGRALSRLVGPR